jgi:hypothetical protein
VRKGAGVEEHTSLTLTDELVVRVLILFVIEKFVIEKFVIEMAGIFDSFVWASSALSDQVIT